MPLNSNNSGGVFSSYSPNPTNQINYKIKLLEGDHIQLKSKAAWLCILYLKRALSKELKTSESGKLRVEDLEDILLLSQ